MAKRLVIANWKMNPKTVEEGKKLIAYTRKQATNLKKTSIVVAPPFPLLGFVSKSKFFDIGAQNVFWQTEGAFTGEISPAQLVSLGVSYVIIGHSERRALGETNEEISKKVKAVLKHGLIPVVCVGERERDSQGDYLHFLDAQVKASLSGVFRSDLPRIIIAYEPIWAIGKTSDEAVNPHKLHEMVIFIRKILTGISSREIAQKVNIVYGGSVEPKNTRELLLDGKVGGFLVGHASLKREMFGEILKIVDKA